MIPYNQASKLSYGMANGLKCVLLKPTATPDITHTTYAEVVSGSQEVFLAGTWPEGGKAVENIVVTTINVNDATFSFDDLIVTPPTAMGPFRYAVIVRASDGAPIAYENFGTDKYFPANFAGGIGLTDGYLCQTQV